MKHLLTISIIVFVVCAITLMFPYASSGYSSGERTIRYGNDQIELASIQLLGILVITLISCIKKNRATSIIAFILCIPFALWYFILFFAFTFFRSNPEMEIGYFIAILAALIFIVSHFINMIMVFRNHKQGPSDLLIDDDLLE